MSSINGQINELSDAFVDVRIFGAVADGVTDNTSAYNAAMNYMNEGQTLFFPSGSWKGNITLTKDAISIVGSGMPYYENGAEVLVGGTIIIGFINLNDKPNASVSNLGIDQTGTLDIDGITAGDNSLAVPLYQSFKDISILGRGYTGVSPATSTHGMKLESGTDVFVDNVKIYKFAHGVAVKTSNSNISNIYTEDVIYDSVIVKSDTAHPLVENVNINNVVAKSLVAADPGLNNSLVVQSYNIGSITRNVNVNNFISYNSGGQGVSVFQTAGTNNFINFTNCIVSNSAQESFFVSSGDSVIFNNCQAIGSGNYSFKNTSGTNIYIISAISSNPTTGNWLGTFVEKDVNGIKNLTGPLGVGMFTSPVGILDVAKATFFAGDFQLCRFLDGTNLIGGISTKVFDATSGNSFKSGFILQTNNGNQTLLDRLTIDRAGFVGIGTTAPETLLHVSGGNILLSNDKGLYIEDSGGTNQKAVFYNSANQMQFGNFLGGGTSDVEIFAGGSDKLHIEGTGNVGIGITSPTAILHLKASTATANTASLKIDSGVVATVPVSGNIESDGTHLYWTDSGGTRRQLDN